MDTIFDVAGFWSNFREEGSHKYVGVEVDLSAVEAIQPIPPFTRRSEVWVFLLLEGRQEPIKVVFFMDEKYEYVSFVAGFTKLRDAWKKARAERNVLRKFSS